MGPDQDCPSKGFQSDRSVKSHDTTPRRGRTPQADPKGLPPSGEENGFMIEPADEF